MKNIIYFSAFTLMLAATCVSFTACGGDDAEEDGDNTDKLKNQTITVNGVSFKMIGVEDGTFQMAHLKVTQMPVMMNNRNTK